MGIKISNETFKTNNQILYCIYFQCFNECSNVYLYLPKEVNKLVQGIFFKVYLGAYISQSSHICAAWNSLQNVVLDISQVAMNIKYFVILNIFSVEIYE